MIVKSNCATCYLCNSEFIAKQSNYKTCSKECRVLFNSRQQALYYFKNKVNIIKRISSNRKAFVYTYKCKICTNAFSSLRKGTTCCSDACRRILNNIVTCQRSKNLSIEKREAKNLEKRIKYGKNWNTLSGQRKIKAQKRKNRLNNDINFKLADTLRSRLKHAIKGNYKSGSAVKDLGCSIEELKLHLESKFQPGMIWENWFRDGWHIDHIKPLSSFNLEDPEQLKEACNYINLQPLWAKDNLSKGNNDNGLLEKRP